MEAVSMQITLRINYKKYTTICFTSIKNTINSKCLSHVNKLILSNLV